MNDFPVNVKVGPTYRKNIFFSPHYTRCPFPLANQSSTEKTEKLVMPIQKKDVYKFDLNEHLICLILY